MHLDVGLAVPFVWTNWVVHRGVVVGIVLGTLVGKQAWTGMANRAREQQLLALAIPRHRSPVCAFVSLPPPLKIIFLPVSHVLCAFT